MLAVKSTHLKTILSMALAILLAISVLPLLTYNASAASSYYSVTGTVTDATMNTITVLSNDRYRSFGKSDAKLVNASKGIALGDIVKITYNASNKKEAVQITMLSHSSSANRTPHETATFVAVIGSVRDITMNTITILSEGRRRTFGTENTDVLNAPDGIMVGDRVRVIYYSNNTSEAVQILMISPGENHYSDDDNNYGSGAANRSFSGWISDMGDHYIVVQDLQNGRSITFYYNENDYSLPEIAIGDVVKVLYNDNHPGTALRIVMVDQGNNH